MVAGVQPVKTPKNPLEPMEKQYVPPRCSWLTTRVFIAQ